MTLARIITTSATTAILLAAASVAFAEGPSGGGPSARTLRHPAQAGPRQTVGVRGSTTWEPINDRLATRFEYVEPKIDNHVEYPPGGSTFGIRQLIEGTCLERGITDPAICDVNGDGLVKVDDLLDGSGPGFVPAVAQSSRAINATELAKAAAAGLALRGASVGIDGLGVVVNAANPVTAQMTGQNVTDIYMLGSKVWEDFGVTLPACVDGTGFSRIHVYSRTPEGGTFGSFNELYVDPWWPGNAAASETALRSRLDAPWGAGPIDWVDTALDGEAAVAADVCGIFFAGVGDIAQNPGVKALKTTKGVLPGQFPTFDTISSGQFEFSRNLWLYWVDDQAPTTGIAKYVAFLQSQAGQAVITEASFVPQTPQLEPLDQAAHELSGFPAYDPQDAHE